MLFSVHLGKRGTSKSSEDKMTAIHGRGDLRRDGDDRTRSMEDTFGAQARQ
jgi:hypothetical protein